MKNMNDHYVRDEADDWLEYRIGTAAAAPIFNKF